MLRDLRYLRRAAVLGVAVGTLATAVMVAVEWRYRGNGPHMLLARVGWGLVICALGGIAAGVMMSPLGLIADGAHSAYVGARKRRTIRVQASATEAGQLSNPDNADDGALSEAAEPGALEYARERPREP